MNQYIIADEHYGHSNILAFRDPQDRLQRTFNTVTEMREYMIKKHNSVVQKGDVTFHLGDFYFGTNWRDVQYILSRLNGDHVLILGNHDHLRVFDYVEAGFHSVHTSFTMQGVTLIHDPAVAGVFTDSNYVHGHTHSLGLQLRENTYCVSVELHDYTPVPLWKALDSFKIWKNEEGH